MQLRFSHLGLVVSALVIQLVSLGSYAADPAGAPGLPHQWAPALKQAVGTAYEKSGAQSPVWFTIADGIVTEVFYPSVDMAQVGDLQFMISDGESFFSEQKRDAVSTVSYKDDAGTVRISGRDRSGRYRFAQEIITDPSSPVLRIKTRFVWMQPGLRLFILYKPTINNTGSGNLGWATTEGLFATKATPIRVMTGRQIPQVFSALLTSQPIVSASAGYVGFSDGWQDLARNFRLTRTSPQAGPGNVALTAEVQVPPGTEFTFEMALGFGRNRPEAETYAKAALGVPFNKVRDEYDAGWEEYLEGLRAAEPGRNRFMTTSKLAQRSAITIKMHEDKAKRGAIVASLSKPGAPSSDTALDGTGGYHLVWPRDLYHAAMGLLAAGDRETPKDILNYLIDTQNPDGSWYQNFWVDGSAYWRGLQLDEVAFPIILAAKLSRKGLIQITDRERDMIRDAARFIVQHGPTSPQDRWEEIGGYIPSTLASEIAALDLTAALIGEEIYASIARDWRNKLDAWTVVPEGPHGRNYYLRTSPSGNPGEPEPIHLANGAGRAFAAEIIDGGFLELVRLGVRNPHHSAILNTLQIYDSAHLGIAEGHGFQGTAGGLSYRRYNRDGYGHQGVGGYWPLLAGERGHYSVASGDLPRARSQLAMMERAALPSGMIPEQVISSGSMVPTGKGVACPLVWAHAEDILLHRSIEEGAIFDSP